MTTPLEKGNELENAVKAIESVILLLSPSLEKDSFLIESKKIVVIDGVKHEIDIWVEIDHGNGYESIFIFECKNWERSVGKNEIIVFSEKINAVQAQRGFFVAKSFTKDAKAQANKDKRITLLNAKEYPTNNMPVPFDFHFVSSGKRHGDLLLEESKIEGKNENQIKFDIEKINLRLNNEFIDFDKYIKNWIKDCADRLINAFPSSKKPADIYELEAADERLFNEGELLFDERKIKKLKLHVKTSVRLVRPRIISHYEVQTRGRILTLEPVKFEEGGHIQVSFLGEAVELNQVAEDL